MKTLTNIAAFDNNPYLLALLKGYCYANYITLTAFDFNTAGINDMEKLLKPIFVVIPLELINSAKSNLAATLLKRVSEDNDAIHICGLAKLPSDSVTNELAAWLDVSLTLPLDISDIDQYLKTQALLPCTSNDEQRSHERRSFSDRRGNDYANVAAVNAQHTPSTATEMLAFQGFKIDQRNKCLFLNGHKIELTPKEFELLGLLSTDTDRIFMADEIINHLWPQSNRATKSDLYQYMHLLRKKIEKDVNNPQWIMNVKGFGYKLNTAH